MLSNLLDRIGDYNPQLLRELKGRFKPYSLVLTITICSLTYLSFLILFLTEDPRHFFIPLSFLGVFTLLCSGCYFLINDLVQEENRGTLNFIRLSPQSAVNILIGKLLGVPSLIYGGALLLLPLHLILGLRANIPLYLIGLFYALIIANCALFYSGALLVGLATSSNKQEKLQALGGVAVVFILLSMTGSFILPYGSSLSKPNLAWLLVLFNPLNFLAYLIPPERGQLHALSYLNWFGLKIWEQPLSAFGFSLLLYSLGLAGIWHGLKRRFFNSQISLISKATSYIFTGVLTVFLLGFIWSIPDVYGSHVVKESLAVAFFIITLFFTVLINSLNGRRPSLLDWSRYRHQTERKLGLIQDLIWGDKSPATLAIFLNLSFVSVLMVITIYRWAPIEEQQPLLTALVIGSGLILVYASLGQWAQLIRSPKQAAGCQGALTLLFMIPIVALPFNPNLLQWNRQSFLIIIVEGILIYSSNLLMAGQLENLGESQTKALFSQSIIRQ